MVGDRFSTEAEYEELKPGGFEDKEDKEPVFNKVTGYYIGSE